MSETNGTTTQEETSTLDKLHAEFTSQFKGKTTKARTKELVAALETAQANRSKAEAAVEAAKAGESAAVAAIIRECSGKSKITIKGETYSPMSRGSSVFLRRLSGESIELA